MRRGRRAVWYKVSARPAVRLVHKTQNFFVDSEVMVLPLAVAPTRLICKGRTY